MAALPIRTIHARQGSVLTATKTPSPTGKSNQDHEAPNTKQLGLERIVFFSDAVFAIAITLLALEIRLPIGYETLSNSELLASLLGIWHKYLAFGISFLVIGTFWTSHHRKFLLIERYDNGLITLNLLILMVIAFIPFPSSVISDNGNRTGTILYALTMLVAGLLFAALWWHATLDNRLVADDLSQAERRREFLSPILTVVIFLLSIGVALLNADLAKLTWLLLFPVTIYVNRG